MKRKIAPVILLLLALTAGCVRSGGGGGPRYVPRPGSVSELDSRIYDVLLVSEAIITDATQQSVAGTLDNTLKAAINRLIPIHNAADLAWKIYRAVHGTSDQARAEAHLMALMGQLRDGIIHLQGGD